jgi:hypothetical protein
MKNEQQAALRSALVDEYGDLAAELAPFKHKQSRLDELAKIMRGWYAGEAAELPFTAAGERYQAVLGAKSVQSHIDITAAWRALGRKKFLLAASVTLKALEAFLQPEQLSALVTKERTGSRSLVVTPLPAQPQK